MRTKILLLTALSFVSLPAVAQGVPCIDLKCPTNIVVDCQSTAGTPVVYTVTATNFCGTNVTVVCVPPSGSLFFPGTVIVNCTASGSGQTNRCSFPVTVTGNCVSNCLTIICPSNRLVQCPANIQPPALSVGQFQLFGGIIQSTCDSALGISSSDSVLTNPCGGTIVRTYTVTALNQPGITASCVQIFTVKDTVAPVIVGVPGNTNVQCLNSLPPANVTTTDNCDSNVTLILTITSNGVCPTIIVRTWTASDRCANTSSATQTITVEDTIPPVLVGVPGNTNFNCVGFLPGAFVTATDNCDGTNVAVQLTITTNGTCPRTIVRTWTARDRCTNTISASQTITVIDTVPPTIICPSNLVLQCLADIPPCATNITQFRARGGIANDNCTSNLLYFCSDAAIGNGGGLNPCFATIFRTHTVMDACSNAASCVQTITVRDTIPPVITCPADITIETCSNRQVFYQATAVDNCDPNVIATCVPLSGSFFGPGVTVVTCQAIDRCSNRAACTFTVTAHCTSNSCLSITNRETTCVSNRMFHTTFEIANLTPGPVSYVAFTDLPPGVTVTPDLIPLDPPLPTGASTTVSVTFTIPENSLTVLTTLCFRVSIHNAAFIECCAIQYCIEVPTCCLELSGESLSCATTTGGFTYSFDLRNLSGVPVKYLFLAPEPDCFDVVPDIITLVPPLPSGGVRHFVVTLNNVQAACGANLCLRLAILDSNMVQCCSILRCLPNPAVTRIKCPSNIVAQCQSPAGTTVFYDAHASSLCGSNLPVNCVPPSGSLFPPGLTTVHCQTLGSNFTDKCEFTVTVVGTCGGPCVELRCPSNVVAQCTSPAGALVNYSVSLSNPCSNFVSGISCFPPSGSQFPIGTTLVNCTVVAQGQSNRCQFPVIVTGNCVSNCVELICPSNFVRQCSGMTQGTRVDYPQPVVLSQCGTNLFATCVPPSGSFFPIGTTVVNCTAGLPGAVPARCSFTITILAGPPCTNMDNCVELRCPSNITAICTTPLGGTVVYSVFATNRCSTNLVVSCIPPSGSTFPAGTTTVRCTAFGNGFSNLCNFTVTIVGNCGVGSPLNLVVARDGNVVELMLPTIEGVTSQIEYSDSFELPDWKLFRTVTGDGSVMMITDSVNAASQRFYRLRLDP